MYNIVAFIIVFALNCIYYKPAFTVAMICFGILCIFEYKKKQLQLPTIDPIILKSFGVFWAGVIFASLLTFDIDCIKKAFDYVYWTLPFWMIVILGYNKKIIEGLAMGLTISTLIMCGYGLYQHIFENMARIKSFYPNPNYLGTILAMLIPFLGIFIFVIKNKIYRFLLLLSLLSSMVCLYFSQSRGAILGLLLGICVWIVCYYWNKINSLKKFCALCSIIAVVSAFCLYFVYNFERVNEMERVYIFQSSINMWRDNKFIGVGLGNFGKLYSENYILPQATAKYIDKSHNIITAFLAETGIIGTIGFVFMNFGIFCFILKKSKQNRYNFILGAGFIAFIALNIHGIVDSTFNYQAINRLFWGLFGISYIFSNKNILSLF